MTRVLVCGGRDYGRTKRTSADGREQASREIDRLYAVLNKLHANRPIGCIIHGSAAGADSLAGDWAEGTGVSVDVYEADWENQGSFAGPARNKRMLDEGRPDLVIAFPGGRGTADMIRKARKAGVEVVEIFHG